MKTLGLYTEIANNYNKISTAPFRIPSSLGNARHLLIDDDGLKLYVTIMASKVTKIEFIIDDMDNPIYPGIFQSFEFGMKWSGTPSFISSLINAKENIGHTFQSVGDVSYQATVDEKNLKLFITLTPVIKEFTQIQNS